MLGKVTSSGLTPPSNITFNNLLKHMWEYILMAREQIIALKTLRLVHKLAVLKMYLFILRFLTLRWQELLLPTFIMVAPILLLFIPKNFQTFSRTHVQKFYPLKAIALKYPKEGSSLHF